MKIPSIFINFSPERIELTFKIMISKFLSQSQFPDIKNSNRIKLNKKFNIYYTRTVINL